MIFSDIMRFDPWRELDRLQQEVNRLFERSWFFDTRKYPPVNIWTNPEAVIVTAELPGYDPKDIHLSVTQDELVIEGRRPAEELKEGEQYHRQERRTGDFRRVVDLPFVVDSDKVEAAYEKGILKITLPRAEEDKPKKIQIKTN
ncbi:MAG: Hsp20/alpha crystallin family protein [Calditrichia bacterium]